MRTDKILAAIEFLKEGRSALIDDIQFNTNEFGEIVVTGYSQFINLKNITKEIAIKELEETKSAFLELVENSNDFKKFIEDRSIIFNLSYDDAGKLSFLICSERNGVISWKM